MRGITNLQEGISQFCFCKADKCSKVSQLVAGSHAKPPRKGEI